MKFLFAACAFNHDGSRIVSASYDNTLRIWDADSGEPTDFMAHHLPEGTYASLTPDHRQLLGASPNAWPWLAWMEPDPTTGELKRLPIESYGGYSFFE